MRKEILKTFIILIALIPMRGPLLFSEEEPLETEELGSEAELYSAFSPALSFEEYIDREAELRGMVIKKRVKQDTLRSHQNLTSALQIIFAIRERFREFERRRAEILMRPVRSATPSKTVNEDGSVTFSGTNTKIAKYILRKYFRKYGGEDLREGDIKEVEERIDSTPGKFAHKGFSITFNYKDTDKLGNETKFPIQVSLRNEETHFPDWIFYKSIAPRYMKDSNGIPKLGYDVFYNYIRYVKCEGDWWGFNSKETNAYGWATEVWQENIDLRTGLVTQVEQEIKEMDFEIREARRYHRKVTESYKGLYSYSYEEDVKVLGYYSTLDEDRNIKYLPSIVETIRYNDERAPSLIVKSYSQYDYDEKDRVVRSLVISHYESKEGDISYNSINLNEVLKFDPLTGLTAIEYDSYQVPYKRGSFEEGKRYAEIIWDAMHDPEVLGFAWEMAEEGLLYKIAQEIAKLVMSGEMSYEVAKLNVIAKYRAKEAEGRWEEIAESLIGGGDPEEIDELKGQLKYLSKVYGEKFTLPNL